MEEERGRMGEEEKERTKKEGRNGDRCGKGE